jgi:hypothetical protein
MDISLKGMKISLSLSVSREYIFHFFMIVKMDFVEDAKKHLGFPPINMGCVGEMRIEDDITEDIKFLVSMLFLIATEEILLGIFHERS